MAKQPYPETNAKRFQPLFHPIFKETAEDYACDI